MIKYFGITAIWFVAASFVFSILVYFLFNSGFVKETRNEKGALKKKQSIIGLVSISGFSLLIIVFLYYYDYALFAGIKASFFNVLIANFAMLMLLTTYDSFIIDLLVIGVWRPGFLHIPAQMNLLEMKKHVRRTYIFGWIFIIPLTLIPSTVYFLIN